MRKLIQFLLLFAIGGLGYNVIEILWRGFSHPSMTLAGGLCFVFIGLFNELMFEYEDSIWVQALMGSIFITIVELAIGMVVNLQMGLGVWDYSDMPLNFLGQIALQPSIGWFFLSVGIIFIDDWIRRVLFSEPIRKYNYSFRRKKTP